MLLTRYGIPVSLVVVLMGMLISACGGGSVTTTATATATMTMTTIPTTSTQVKELGPTTYLNLYQTVLQDMKKAATHDWFVSATVTVPTHTTCLSKNKHHISMWVGLQGNDRAQKIVWLAQVGVKQNDCGRWFYWYEPYTNVVVPSPLDRPFPNALAPQPGTTIKLSASYISKTQTYTLTADKNTISFQYSQEISALQSYMTFPNTAEWAVEHSPQPDVTFLPEFTPDIVFMNMRVNKHPLSLQAVINHYSDPSTSATYSSTTNTATFHWVKEE